MNLVLASRVKHPENLAGVIYLWSLPAFCLLPPLFPSPTPTPRFFTAAAEIRKANPAW